MLYTEEELEKIWTVSREKYKIQQIKREWMDMIRNTVNTWTERQDIFEIGCYDGGSTYFLSNFARHMFTIDNNVPCRFNPEEMNCKYEYIGGDSHDPHVFNKVWDNKYFDPKFCFIDGDHSWEGVKADFNNTFSKIGDGVTFAFHDIVITDFHHTHKCYVGEFWEELKEKYPDWRYEEYKAEVEIWGGIGVIKL